MFNEIRPEWHERAACRGMVNVFFSDQGDRESQQLARRICDSCPVFDDCRRYIENNNERYGIWAGRSGDKYRRELSITRQPVNHGTPRMYRNGCRCDLCRQANSTYNRELYRRSKVRGAARKRRVPMVHGKTSTYTRGCRCDECRAAQATYMRAYKARKRAGTQVSA